MDQLLEPEDEEPTVRSGAPLDTEAGATASPEPPATGQTSNEPLPKRARFNKFERGQTQTRAGRTILGQAAKNAEDSSLP